MSAINILVIDGQGGRLGKGVIERLQPHRERLNLTAIGTNSIATALMVKAGVDSAATGENPVIVNSRNADIIVGPIGIVLADSLVGEVTSAMAAAVGASRAHKILMPINRCNTHIVGSEELSLAQCVDSAMDYILKYIDR